MIINLAKMAKLPLINIVRREEQAKKLRQNGEKFVLNSSKEGFFDEF